MYSPLTMTKPEETHFESEEAAQAAAAEAQRTVETHYEVDSATPTDQAEIQRLVTQYLADNLNRDALLALIGTEGENGEPSVMNPNVNERIAATKILFEGAGRDQAAQAAAESVQNLDAFGRPLSDVPEGEEPEIK